jgi:hypothetical protein
MFAVSEFQQGRTKKWSEREVESELGGLPR